MATACIAQLTFKDEPFLKPVTVAFDQEYASSDGGLLLLKALDACLGVTTTLAGGLHDGRQPGKIQHSVLDLVRQRVSGWRWATPTATTPRGVDDPLHNRAFGPRPADRRGLSSQPTLSRFENAIIRPALVRMLHGVPIRHRQHRRRWGPPRAGITIDLDPTEDPTHGPQELKLLQRATAPGTNLPLSPR